MKPVRLVATAALSAWREMQPPPGTSPARSANAPVAARTALLAAFRLEQRAAAVLGAAVVHQDLSAVTIRIAWWVSVSYIDVVTNRRFDHSKGRAILGTFM